MTKAHVGTHNSSAFVTFSQQHDGILSTVASHQKLQTITIVKSASSTSDNNVKEKKQPHAWGGGEPYLSNGWGRRSATSGRSRTTAAAASTFARGTADVDADGRGVPAYGESALKENMQSYFSYLMDFMTWFHGKDVLCACWSDAQDIIVPESLRWRVKNAYNQLEVGEAYPTRSFRSASIVSASN